VKVSAKAWVTAVVREWATGLEMASVKVSETESVKVSATGLETESVKVSAMAWVTALVREWATGLEMASVKVSATGLETESVKASVTALVREWAMVLVKVLERESVKASATASVMPWERSYHLQEPTQLAAMHHRSGFDIWPSGFRLCSAGTGSCNRFPNRVSRWLEDLARRALGNPRSRC
jgi:hypothetical protein